MLCGRIGVTIVYNFVLRKYSGGGVRQHPPPLPNYGVANES